MQKSIWNNISKLLASRAAAIYCPIKKCRPDAHSAFYEVDCLGKVTNPLSASEQHPRSCETSCIDLMRKILKRE